MISDYASFCCMRAEETAAESIFRLVQDTILTVYPKFYQKEIVEFFCKLHSLENIIYDIRHNTVFVLYKGNVLTGTGAVSQDHITRMYVAPAFQGQGCGSLILKRLEEEIKKNYSAAQLDASLPAREMYSRRGYITVRHDQCLTDNGIVLSYEVMKKELR